MAQGKKTGGRNFTPGISGNPKGRPKLSDDIKEIKKLNSEKLMTILNETLFLSGEEINKILKDEHVPAASKMVAAVIQRTIQIGDSKGLELFIKILGCNNNDENAESASGAYIKPELLKYIGPSGELLIHNAILDAIEKDESA